MFIFSTQQINKTKRKKTNLKNKNENCGKFERCNIVI